MYRLAQASESELERVTAEVSERPMAGAVKGLWQPWIGIAALAVFLWIVQRGGPPKSGRRMGKALWE